MSLPIVSYIERVASAHLSYLIERGLHELAYRILYREGCMSTPIVSYRERVA